MGRLEARRTHGRRSECMGEREPFNCTQAGSIARCHPVFGAAWRMTFHGFSTLSCPFAHLSTVAGDADAVAAPSRCSHRRLRFQPPFWCEALGWCRIGEVTRTGRGTSPGYLESRPSMWSDHRGTERQGTEVNLDTRLSERHAASGEFGTMFLAQARSTAGVQVVAVAAVKPQRPR